MERPRGIGARLKQRFDDLLQKPGQATLDLRAAMQDHNVYTSKDLPRSVRSKLAIEILQRYKDARGKVYDGGDFFTLDTWWGLHDKLGADAIADAVAAGFVSRVFLGIKAMGRPQWLEDELFQKEIKEMEELGIRNGWKQDEPVIK